MSLPHSISQGLVLIKINRDAQQRHREMIGSLYLNPHQVFLKQNLQHGEVVMIGEGVEKLFSSIRPGDTLIFHHFIEGSMQTSNSMVRENNQRFLFNDDDKEYRYYVVPIEHIYAVDNGAGKIQCAPDFLFGTAIEENQTELVIDGMVVIQNYKESRDLIQQKLERLQKENLELNKYAKGDPAIMRSIQEKEMEMARITQSLNKKKMKPYRIEHSNKNLPGFSGHTAWYSLVGESVTSITYKDKNYSILRTKYIGYLDGNVS